METAENKAVVRRIFLEVMSTGDLGVLDALYDPAFVAHNPGGRDADLTATRRAIETLHRVFPDTRYTIEDMLADEDRVATRFTRTGTHLGPFRGLPSTGRRVTVTGITIHRLRAGKVIEGWLNFDDLGVMQQLGLVPNRT